MKLFADTIPAILTKDLKLSDVPDESQPAADVNAFALTLDLDEVNPWDLKEASVEELSDKNSLLELRAYLYREQRRYNNSDLLYPDGPEVMRKIVSLIRKKLS